MPRVSQHDHIEELEQLIYRLAKLLRDSKIMPRHVEDDLQKIIDTIPLGARLRSPEDK